jgi:hypothetical protein
MSILGKILAILNIFAVIGALALMAMAYGQRQAWQYAIYHEDLMLKGLPVGENETDPLQQKSVELLDEPTLKTLFPSGNPVKTQLAEVSRVKSALEQQINSAGDKRKQLVALSRILMPMVVTSEQWAQLLAYQTYLGDDKSFKQLQDRLTQADTFARQPPRQGPPKPYNEQAFHEALAAQFSEPPGVLGEEFLAVKVAEPNTPVEKALDQSLDKQLTQLRGQFDQMFRDVQNAGGEENRSNAAANAQRRGVIARLLFNMVEPLAEGGAAANLDLMGNPAYKRFIMVVGVEAAVDAVNDQANILQGIATELALQRQKERDLFAVEHRKELELVLDKKDEIDQHRALLAMKKKELASHEEALKKRRLDIDFYREQLKSARDETDLHLRQLRQMSDALHQERLKLRDNTADNQKLEKEIRTLEQGR